MRHAGLTADTHGLVDLADPSTSGLRPREELRLRIGFPPGASARVDTEFDGLVDSVSTIFVAFDALTGGSASRSGPAAPAGEFRGGVPPAPTGRDETAGGRLNTWTDHLHAGGTKGPDVASGQTVRIACRTTGFRVEDGNTAWYRIASAPWNSAFYVSADGFYNNGRTSGLLDQTPWFDPAVPTC